MQLQKSKGNSIKEGHTSPGRSLPWAALMIPKLTQGCTQKTNYHKTNKKIGPSKWNKRQYTVAKGDTISFSAHKISTKFKNIRRVKLR